MICIEKRIVYFVRVGVFFYTFHLWSRFFSVLFETGRYLSKVNDIELGMGKQFDTFQWTFSIKKKPFFFVELFIQNVTYQVAIPISQNTRSRWAFQNVTNGKLQLNFEEVSLGRKHNIYIYMSILAQYIHCHSLDWLSNHLNYEQIIISIIINITNRSNCSY